MILDLELVQATSFCQPSVPKQQPEQIWGGRLDGEERGGGQSSKGGEEDVNYSWQGFTLHIISPSHLDWQYMQEKEGRRISMLLNDNNFGRSLTCEQIVKKHLEEDLVDEKSKEKKTDAQWRRRWQPQSQL